MARNKVIVTAGEALKKEGILASPVALPGTFVEYGIGGYAVAGAGTREIAIVDYTSADGMDVTPITGTSYQAGDQIPVLYPERAAEVNVIADTTAAVSFVDGGLVAIGIGGAVTPFVDVLGGTVIGKAKEDVTLALGAVGKVKIELFAAPVVIAAVTYNLTGFTAIGNIDGGTTADPTYADAAAVQAILPDVVQGEHVGGAQVVNVPVASWTDTDTYNPAQAGSYTFTAVLGNLPAGYTNTDNKTATVEVVVQ